MTRAGGLWSGPPRGGWRTGSREALDGRPSRSRGTFGPIYVPFVPLATGSTVTPAGLAFAAAAVALAGLADLAAGLAAGASGRRRRGAGALSAAADVFPRAGSEGRDPPAAERRRLLAGGAAAAFVAGVFLFGLRAGFLAAVVAPAAASRALRARRERYRRG